jgi:hypothetical protein
VNDTDLNDLLATASRTDGTDAFDARADLTRGRRALARIRRRRAAGGVLTLAVAGVIGTGVVRAGSDDNQQAPPTAEHRESKESTDQIRLVSQTLEAGPYTFDKTPEGWRDLNYAHPEFAVVIGRASGNQDPEHFIGKLVIMMSTNPPAGEQVEYDGRTYWVHDDGGGDHTRITTMTRPGEPEGALEIQFPNDAGWSQETMLEFLSTVKVGAAAQPGMG